MQDHEIRLNTETTAVVGNCKVLLVIFVFVFVGLVYCYVHYYRTCFFPVSEVKTIDNMYSALPDVTSVELHGKLPN